MPSLALPAAPASTEARVRVLLVEDNSTDALLVEVALEEMTAPTPELHHVELLSEAEAALQSGEFDVALIDLNLPDGQGLENFERLQIVAPAVPMIVLTGLADEEVAVEAIARGASDYLIKGEVPAALLERSMRYAIERKRNENGRLELVKARVEREEAEAANAAKDQFLATISHELRTPLNAIMGWTSLVRGGGLDEETTQQALEVIERNARVQAQLIEDLLDVSRIISGNFRLEFGEIDLRAIAQSAAETLQPQIRDKHLDLQLILEPVPALCGDPTRLQQLTWNLLSNAIKFTPAGGQIWLRTCRRANDVVLEVVDSGQGIAPEFLPHIFDRFRQADGSTTRRHGGLGLGLAIVRHIAELHHGTVEAHSDGDGQGARFVATLPVLKRRPMAGEPGRSCAGRRLICPGLGRRHFAVGDSHHGRQIPRSRSHLQLDLAALPHFAGRRPLHPIHRRRQRSGRRRTGQFSGRDPERRDRNRRQSAHAFGGAHEKLIGV